MTTGWLMSALLVGTGGFVGSVARYAASGLVYRFTPTPVVPYGTLLVNVAGCLAIGILASMSESRLAIGHDLRLFLFIGVLGGFTTFSTFGYESVMLLQDSQLKAALANILLQVVLGLGAAWLGLGLGRSI